MGYPVRAVSRKNCALPYRRPRKYAYYSLCAGTIFSLNDPKGRHVGAKLRISSDCGSPPPSATRAGGTLFSAQYEEIVNRRRDPCLVEFSGNGSYTVRIFPAESYNARKVELEFQHTLNDDSASLITATIPLAFDKRRSTTTCRPSRKGLSGT